MPKKWKSPDPTVFGPAREFDQMYDDDRYELERWDERTRSVKRDYNRNDIEES